VGISSHFVRTGGTISEKSPQDAQKIQELAQYLKERKNNKPSATPVTRSSSLGIVLDLLKNQYLNKLT
jgi:hypothetical protein